MSIFIAKTYTCTNYLLMSNDKARKKRIVSGHSIVSIGNALLDPEDTRDPTPMDSPLICISLFFPNTFHCQKGRNNLEN